MNDAGDGETVLDFLIIDAVAAQEAGPCLAYFVCPSPYDLLQDLHIVGLRGEADDIHGGQRHRTHRVDVAEGVCSGDLAEIVRIVHHRGKEVEGLDQGQFLR